MASIVSSINDGEIYRFVSKPWNNQELARVLAEGAAVARALRQVRCEPVPAFAVDGTLLVVEREPDLIRTVRFPFSRRYKVLYAPSADSALDLMVNEDVAVLLADVDGHQAQMTTMLKLLKQEQPQMLGICSATSAADSQLLIELINQALDGVYSQIWPRIRYRLTLNHLTTTGKMQPTLQTDYTGKTIHTTLLLNRIQTVSKRPLCAVLVRGNCTQNTRPAALVTTSRS